MAMFNCPECKKRISDTATSCPKCGAKITEEIRIKAKEDAKKGKIGCLIIIIIIIVFSILIGTCSDKPENKPEKPLEETLNIEKKTPQYQKQISSFYNQIISVSKPADDAFSELEKAMRAKPVDGDKIVLLAVKAGKLSYGTSEFFRKELKPPSGISPELKLVCEKILNQMELAYNYRKEASETLLAFVRTEDKQLVNKYKETLELSTAYMIKAGAGLFLVQEKTGLNLK